MHSQLLESILDFFREIKLPFELTQLGEETFMPGMTIVRGTLWIDPEKLQHPGDLLHEAGHIAVTPVERRHDLGGDMKKAGHRGGEEMAAIAWSWAALNHIGLAPEVVFHPQGYKGGSQSLIEAFTNRTGFGYPLLRAWLMCEAPEHTEGYPKMQRWLRM
jgi:hypothetical protein